MGREGGRFSDERYSTPNNTKGFQLILKAWVELGASYERERSPVHAFLTLWGVGTVRLQVGKATSHRVCEGQSWCAPVVLK